MLPPEINPAQFAAFVLIFIRVSILVFLAPIFGSNLVPSQVKAALALVLAFVLSLVIPVDPSALPADLLSFAPLVLGEVFMALAITLLV
ncbi:MAG: flagellar biosynthetic protein FliR, partial [Thermodesulfobacteriota bacterium]